MKREPETRLPQPPAEHDGGLKGLQPSMRSTFGDKITRLDPRMPSIWMTAIPAFLALLFWIGFIWATLVDPDKSYMAGLPFPLAHLAMFGLIGAPLVALISSFLLLRRDERVSVPSSCLLIFSVSPLLWLAVATILSG
jgi:hypothetical protein